MLWYRLFTAKTLSYRIYPRPWGPDERGLESVGGQEWISHITIEERVLLIHSFFSSTLAGPHPPPFLLPSPPSFPPRKARMQMCIITPKINWAQWQTPGKCVPLVIAFINFGSIFPEKFYPSSRIEPDNGGWGKKEGEKDFCSIFFLVSEFVLKLFIEAQWRFIMKRRLPRSIAAPLSTARVLVSPCFHRPDPQNSHTASDLKRFISSFQQQCPTGPELHCRPYK